MMIYEKYC